jgi:hypothetical protein
MRRARPLQWRKIAVRGSAWCLVVGLWSLGLLTTYPSKAGHEALPAEAGFPAAKGLHVAMYFLLTLWVSWIPLRRWRWLLVAFLSLHGGGTEFLQLFVPERTGRLADVAIDHVGILLGLLAGWRRWVPRRRHRPKSTISSSRPSLPSGTGAAAA